ncbi:uncharacterized protein LOC125077657 [Vanessa atalanta]|uniref:uncharacterized protein LOC125077657 n=1 Tax=Vanessa atalanta TaxID=42275 RepID=UPI001FCD6907|nr:uncharacterized protein LOC125077657 [Vanessa atalanta]
MDRGIPTRLAPTITSNLNDTMDEAAKHLAKIGTDKGEALQHLVNLMKEQGDAPLAQIQGYQQSYNDGARRIENASSLTNEKVDKGIYESVRGKLTNLTENKPAPEHMKEMPAIIDESAKFLAAPFPESEAEKRRVLADLMARKGDEIIGQEGIYKVTYKEGGDEIMNAPVGIDKSQDENSKKQLLEKMNSVIPDNKLKNLLKEPVNEGATHLSNIIKGRGEAMQVIHDEMKKGNDKSFLKVGKFSKTYGESADMLSSAPHFGDQNPSPVLVEKVDKKIKQLPTDKLSETAKPYIADVSDIATNYIAGVATKECGLNAKALAALGETDEIDSKANITDDVPVSTSSPTAYTSTEPLNIDDDERIRRTRRKREALEEERLRAVSDVDPEREQALHILHSKLRSRGGEILYKQPQTELTHGQASQWLSMKSPMKVDKCVKESADTARLHKKFERKLSNLVANATPVDMFDAMQDVIIESSRILSEYFVSQNF